jgi:uncharacterized protein
MKTKLQLVFYLFFFISSAAFSQEPNPATPFKDGGAIMNQILTQAGEKVSMIYPSGLSRGANFAKLFGENKPTTLWDDSYRQDCFEKSVYNAVTLPLLADSPFDETSSLLGQADEILGPLGSTAKELAGLNTNYVSGDDMYGTIQNFIANSLRQVNPKSFGGVSLQTTNLQHAANALKVLEVTYKVADIAFAAAFREALASDIALTRLRILKGTILNSVNKVSDIALIKAIESTEKKLTASDDYFGALLIEITERKNDFIELGIMAGLNMLKQQGIKSLAKYYLQTGVKAAATKTTVVAGFWTVSVYITYAEIKAIMEQFDVAAVAITSSTLRFYLQRNRDVPDKSNPLHLSIAYLDYMYFDGLLEMSTGILPDFHDFVNFVFGGERDYAQCRESFSGSMAQCKEYLFYFWPKLQSNEDSNEKDTKGARLNSSSINDDYNELVRKIFEITGSENLFRTSIVQIIQIYKQQKFNIPESYWNSLEKEFMDVSINDLTDMILPIYKKYYSKDDLIKLIEFYQTPVGKKLIETQPSIAKELLQVGADWGSQIDQKIRSKLNNYR